MAGNIKGITIELNGDTTKLDKALREVGKETRTVQRQLSEVEKALKLDPGNTDLIKQKQRLLGEEIQSTKDKLGMLRQADQDVSKDMEKGTAGAAEKHSELQRQITVTESKEKALQKEFDKLKGVSGDTLKIAAGFENAGTKIKSVSDKVGSIGKGMTKGVTAPVVAVGAASAKAFTEVDDAMDTVVKKTGASGKSLDSMKKNVENIATSIPTTFQAAGDAVGEVNTRFHLTGKSLESVSAQFVKFADINNADVTDSVRGAQMVMSAFGLKTKDTGSLLGVFTSVSQKTGVSVTDLMNSLVQNGATFRDMGLSAQNAATLLGNFEAAGIDSNTAMGSLKKAMTAFQSKGIDVNKGLKDLIGSLSDGKVTTKDYNYAVSILGKRGADAFVDMAKSGRLSLKGLSSNLSDYGSTVDDTFKGTLDPIDQAKVALNNLKVTGAQIFTSLQEIIAPMLQTLNSKLQALNKWWQTLSPGMQQAIIKTMMIAAAIGPLLIGVAKIGSAIGTIAGGIGNMITIGSKMAAVFSNVGGMAGIMGKAIGFLTSPVGIVIAAILAAIVVGVLLYKNWDKIKAAAQKVFTAIKNVIVPVMNTIKNVITTVWNGIKSFFITVFSAIGKAVLLYFSAYLTVIRTILNVIRTVVRAVWLGIKTVITAVVRSIKTVVSGAWKGIKAVTLAVFGAIKSVARTVWNGIKTAVLTPVRAIKSVVTSIWQGIKSVTVSVWNGIKNAITRPIETAKNIIKRIVDAIKGFFHFRISLPKIPMPHFSVIPSGWKLGDLLKGKIPHLGIKWYAEGGILKKPTAFGASGNNILAGGEAGYEAVAPIDTLKGYVRDAVAEAGGGGQVFNISMTVNGANDPEDWAAQFAKSLKRQMRMG